MSPTIEILIQKISRLPGLGPRSARRIVLHLIQNRERSLEPILSGLQKVRDEVKKCPECGNVDVFQQTCPVCGDIARKHDVICIVESVSDLWAIERTSCYRGQYHVLNGLLSSVDGRGPEFLRLDKLKERCEKNSVNEIIIALSATVEGQTTSHYINSFFPKESKVKITSLARGIPVGGELDYLDDGTLFTAFSERS